MASIPGSVRLTGFIAPTDSTDTFPVFKPIYGLGGLRSVASLTERDAITTQRREPGMIVYVSANTTFYTLGSGLTNSDWSIFSSGSGSGNFLPISGGTVTGSTIFNNGLSANTISGGTLFSGSTDLYQIFAPFGVQSGSYNQEGSNITTGGTNNNQIISVVDSPSFNNIYFSGSASGVALSANTIYSGSTDLSDIFSLYPTGSGTQYYIPLWGTSSSLTNSTIYQDPATGITVFNNVSILGDVTILGTAFTVNTETIQSYDNVILLNYSGTNISAIGGGLYIISGQTSGAPSSWTIDTLGNWSANTQIVAGGGLDVITGTTLSSGGTDLYNIFLTQNTSLGFSGWTASTGLDSIVANNGTGNVANGQFSIIGGRQNTTGGLANSSFIGGGQYNVVNGIYSFIGAGQSNNAGNSRNFIGAGFSNSTTGYYSAIIGGRQNKSNGYASLVGNGKLNTALTSYSVVVGGRQNLSSGYASFVGGGINNKATSYYATISGGLNNKAFMGYSSIGGGVFNIIYGGTSTIGGGVSNYISGNSYVSVIGGGNGNSVNNHHSFIGGGSINYVFGSYSSVVGGKFNKASGNYSSIVGGSYNLTSGLQSFIGGGNRNSATTNYSTVINGSGNTSSGWASVILAGTGNTVSGRNSSIVAGSNINGSANDTMYAPNARLAETIGSVIYSAGTPLEQIFMLSGSNVVTSYATTLTGISASTTYTITHNLNSTDIIPALWNETTGDLIYAKVTNRLINTVDVYFTSSPGADVRVIIKK